MGKILFIQNSLENPWMNYGMPRYRCGSEEMEYGDVFEKCTVCPSTMTTNLTLCDHIYPHMGWGLVMQFAHISMGYLIDGDDSVMHEGMVR